MTTFKVYQTGENNGNHHEIIAQGGIYADKTDLFLGMGFYYWEEDSDRAYEWGESHYRGNYFTFKASLHLDLDFLIDLTYKKYIDFLLGLRRIYSKRREVSGDMKIGAFIDFVRRQQEIDEQRHGTVQSDRPFPFLYSRAIDYSNSSRNVKDRMEFTDREGVSNYLLLKPCSFFCVYDQKSLNLTDQELIRVRP